MNFLNEQLDEKTKKQNGCIRAFRFQLFIFDQAYAHATKKHMM